MAAKKIDMQKIRELGLEVEIDQSPGKVADNLDGVIEASRAVVERCAKENYLAGAPERAVADEELLKSAKAAAEKAVKEARTAYDLPFGVIDAKMKAWTVGIDRQIERISPVADMCRSQELEPKRALAFDYFRSKGAWLGPKFGPMLWAKHPKAWDGKSMTAAKIESEIDAMLLEVRSGFRIIRSLGSIYEERLMEKYLEGDSLSMGPVFAYLAHLTEEAAYIASGGSRWNGWTPDLDLDDEPVASEDVSLRGAPSRIAALKEIAEAIGLTVNGSSCGNDASMVEVLRSRGFSDQQVDRIVTAKEVFGMTSAQVLDIDLPADTAPGEVIAVIHRLFNAESGS